MVRIVVVILRMAKIKESQRKEKTVLHREYSFMNPSCAHAILFGYVGCLLAQFENMRRTPNIANVVVLRCFICDRTALPFNICHSSSDGIRDGVFQMWGSISTLLFSLSFCFCSKFPWDMAWSFELPLKYDIQNRHFSQTHNTSEGRSAKRRLERLQRSIMH